MHSYVKENLLGWHESFAGKKQKKKKLGELLHCNCFSLLASYGIEGYLMMLSNLTKQSNLISCILL